MASRGLGGAETYAGDIMLSLHGAGVDQDVVMAKDAPRRAEIAAAGVRVHGNILAAPLRGMQKARLRRLVEQAKPGLIHCWMRRAASLVPEKTGIPVIGWFGGYYDPRHFARCTQFAGVTRDIVAHMIAQGVPAGHAHFVPTFPDVKDGPPVDRVHLQTPEKAKVILALSRLHPKKGLDTLLRAAQGLAGVHLWLAGEGPLRRALQRLARTLNMEERVRFLGWRTDRGALLRAADVCVLPSRYEPFGTVILEAWAAKTPLVACRSAGPAAHVEDGENGLLVPIDDVKGLAEALKRVLDDKSLRQRLIEGGHARYQDDYTREAVTKRMIALYRELTGRQAK